MWYPILMIVLTGYLLGNLNGSVCMSTLLAHDDVRSHGSGNAGMTNFFRNYGGWGTLLVIIVDMAKTVLICCIGGLLLEPYGYRLEGMILGGIAVSLGHDFPVLLGFRGGKGILCGFAAAIVTDWRVAAVILIVFVVICAVTKYVSLGSILCAITYGICFAVWHLDRPWVAAAGIILGLLALFMHRTNMQRLLKGTENKLHLSKKGKQK